MSAADTQEQLDALEKKITQQQAILEQQRKVQSTLSTALRRVETAIAKSAKALYLTSQQLDTVNYEQQQLLIQDKLLTEQKIIQQAALSKQLKSAYMTGNSNVLQMILNQQQSSETQRLLGYYHYLNQARIDSIAQVKQTLEKLQRIKIELAENKQRLTQLKQSQQTHKQTLASEKLTRSDALHALTTSYLKNSAELEQFQLSEFDIKQILAASEKIEPLQLTGLTSYKRKLPRPAVGKILHSFGSKRHGRLLWKGVTIGGIEGQGVTAIHHGKVIYSDWIKGFGLVLIIDHGKGFMSLYGHNQALLKNAGDMVNAKEKIALLGQSGGQSRPSLYFEIRHKGKAINPSRWLKK